MVDNSRNPLQTHFGLVCCDEAARASHRFAESGSIRVLLLAHAPISPVMTLHPHLTAMPLKRIPLARGKRALRALSIVGWFFPLPSQEYDADSVAPVACLLVLAAVRAPPAARYGGATSVIIGSPPLQMGEQGWGLLGSGPGTACQRCHPMTDGQVHPFNKGSIQPSRKA